MDTVTIAEKILSEKEAAKNVPVVECFGSDAPINFRKPFRKGKARYARTTLPDITDDSGFIPFEKEVERFVNSGENYKKYMRMAFPNDSTENVVNDYEQDFGSMSRLDAINFVNARSSALQAGILNRMNQNKFSIDSGHVAKVDSVVQNKAPNVTPGPQVQE